MKEIAYKGVALKKEEDDFQKKKGPVNAAGSTPTIRTYNTDAEEVLRERKTTKVEMVLAEAAKREAEGAPRLVADTREEENAGFHLTTGRIILILGFLLAFIAGVGSYVIFGIGTGRVVNTEPTTEPARRPPTNMAGNAAKIVLSSSPRAQILADITIAFANTNIAPDESRPVDFSVSTPGTGERVADTGEFLAAVLYQRPREALLRTLAPEYSYKIRGGTEFSGSLLLTVRSYELAFSEMLAWEPNLPDDLLPILNPTTASTFQGIRFSTEWTDAVIGGTDARILSAQNGTVLMGYAFLGNEKLVIAGNENALRAAIEEYAPKKASAGT